MRWRAGTGTGVPLWIFCCEVVSPLFSSFFQKQPSSFLSDFHTEPQVSKDFGVGSSRFTGGCRYWASFLTSLSQSFSVPVMGMRLLALPVVDIYTRHRFSVQLAGRTPLPSQLSYRRNAGAGLATGDFPCVGSWLISRQSGELMAKEAMFPMALLTGSVIPLEILQRRPDMRCV